MAVLVIASFSLLRKNKSSQNPVDTLSPKTKQEQEDIQQEFEKLEAIRKNSDVAPPTEEQIKIEFDALEKQRAEADVVQPTPEQIQKEFEALENMRK